MAARKNATAARMWDIFSSEVIPADASEAQRRDMRRAFYGGVAATLALCQFVIGSPGVSEDEGVEILEAVNQECYAFARAVRQGKA